MRIGGMIVPKKIDDGSYRTRNGILLEVKRGGMCRVLWADAGITLVPIALLEYYWREET